MHIEGLCHGNLTEQEAVDISNIITNTLHVKPLPKELRYYDKVLSIPTGTSLLRSVNVKNKLEANSVVEVLLFFC
jgi:nardilysin